MSIPDIIGNILKRIDSSNFVFILISTFVITIGVYIPPLLAFLSAPPWVFTNIGWIKLVNLISVVIIIGYYISNYMRKRQERLNKARQEQEKIQRLNNITQKRNSDIKKYLDSLSSSEQQVLAILLSEGPSIFDSNLPPVNSLVAKKIIFVSNSLIMSYEPLSRHEYSIYEDVLPCIE